VGRCQVSDASSWSRLISNSNCQNTRGRSGRLVWSASRF